MLAANFHNSADLQGDILQILLVVIYIVFISLGLPDSLFGVAWPVVHVELGIAESFGSVFSVLVGISTGAVSFLSGWLIRKFGTGWVTFFSILLTVIGLTGISFAPNIVVMALFSIILGYGAGAIDTGLNNFVSLHYKTQHMNWLHCFWGIGVTASPIIMSNYLGGGTGSWRRGYRVIAAIQLLIAAITACFLKKWTVLEKKNLPAIGPQQMTKGKNIFQILKIKGVIPSILSMGIYCGMESLIGTWGATYFVRVQGMPPGTAAKWVSLYYGGIMLARLVAGFISMRVSDKMMIRGGIGISFLGMIILALPLGSASCLGLLLIGAGFGPIFPTILHSVPDRFGVAYSADITGYHMGGAYGLGFLVQLAFGYIATATTFKITPFVLLALCACLFADNEATLQLLRRNNQSSLGS